MMSSAKQRWAKWILPCIAALVLCACAHEPKAAAKLVSPPFPGFTKSPYFDEQVLSYRFEPGVSVMINAPAAEKFDASKPTELILYTLPNGNNTAQTFGKDRAEGDDWHFDIQHIGAQTRLLREKMTDKNL
ncbi:MAG: hypothetical protein ABI579_06460, partial [Candidatus Sumerlaeota bacterium]